jgi:hypothetical protein
VKTATYTVKTKDDSKAEQILNEIDLTMIKLERKHPKLTVKT